MKKNNPLKYLLIPVSWIYGALVFLRNWLFDLSILPVKRFIIPVISIGNITVGGTGKTPMVEYLAGLLKNDFRLATLSRGYRRRTRGFILAGKNSSPQQIGDEPCQLKEKFPDIEVAVDHKRNRGIQILINTITNLDLVILDDAFQHRYVKPGLSILLMDFNRPVNDDHLLPYGRLRESVSAAERADIIIITKTPPGIPSSLRESLIKDLNLLPHHHLFFSSIKYEGIKKVFQEPSGMTMAPILTPDTQVVLVCGIACPSVLKEYISGITPGITDLFYPDHHNYTEKDMDYILKIYNQIHVQEKLIITTEKDSVRIKQLASVPEVLKMNMYFIPVKTSFPTDEEEKFNQIILHYVRSNKRDRIVH